MIKMVLVSKLLKDKCSAWLVTNSVCIYILHIYQGSDGLVICCSCVLT